DPDDFGEQGHESRVGRQIQPEGAGEILALELVIAGVVKIAQAAVRQVQVIQHNRGFRVLTPVVRSRGIGQPERIRLGGDQLAGAEIFLRMLEQGPPDIQFLDIDSVELAQLAMRRLEEGPLVALEVDCGHERQHGPGLQAQGVNHLDPDVHNTVLFHPRATLRVEHIARVGGRVQSLDGGQAVDRTRCGAQGQSFRTTSLGQLSGLKPWVLKSAMTMRSRPNPRQAVLAVLPSWVRMSKVWPKCSWWKLK